MSDDRVFIDTNVLTYLFDAREPRKQKQAEQLLLEESREVFVSTQVLQELYVALTKGREPITTQALAERAVRETAGYSIVQIDTPLVLSAIEAARTHKLSFWDALIVRAAAHADCGSLLSEDLNDGQVIDGVRVQNPFAEHPEER
jgi:predicted nucleic acid-binding protein